jgi:hypothetical protein
MAVMGVVVLVLWFVVGQGYFIGAPTETPEPPTIWLVYEGQLYSGLRGSYCWFGKCIDAAFQIPVGTVEVSQGSSVSFLTNSRLKPTNTSVLVFVIDDLGNPTHKGDLVKEGDDKYKVDFQKGVYILQSYANWQDLGDVSYTFRVSIN